MLSLFALSTFAKFGSKRATALHQTPLVMRGSSLEGPFANIPRFPAPDKECTIPTETRTCCTGKEHPALQFIDRKRCSFTAILRCYAEWHKNFVSKLLERPSVCSNRHPVVHRVSHGFADTMGQLSGCFEKVLVSGRPLFVDDTGEWYRVLKVPFDWRWETHKNTFCPRDEKGKRYYTADEPIEIFKGDADSSEKRYVQYLPRRQYYFRFEQRCFLRWLFTPSPAISRVVRQTMAQVPSTDTLVGMHIRSNFLRGGSYMMFHRCFERLRSHMQAAEGTRFTVFLATDSREVRQHMQELLGPQLVYNNGTELANSGNKNTAAASLVFAFADFFALACSDVLMMTMQSTWNLQVMGFARWELNSRHRHIQIEQGRAPEFCGAFNTTGARASMTSVG